MVQFFSILCLTNFECFSPIQIMKLNLIMIHIADDHLILHYITSHWFIILAKFTNKLCPDWTTFGGEFDQIETGQFFAKGIAL